MVFLAHTETGSTGNLARKLGSGDFWLNCRLRRLGQTDKMLAFVGLKSVNHTKSLKGDFVTFHSQHRRGYDLLSFRKLLQKSKPVNLGFKPCLVRIIHLEIVSICSQKCEPLGLGKRGWEEVLYPDGSGSKEDSSMWQVKILTNLNSHNECATDRKF